MDETIKIGLGFVTGRPNVCKVINNTYEQLINQFKDCDKKVELTIFILFDLGYQYTTRVDFYGIIPNVYKDIIVRYITPEDIEEQKKKLIAIDGFSKAEMDLFFGHGHAKGRNTLMYYALKKKMDYLLFWDDDEYPVACIKDENTNEIIWKEQSNIAMHLKYIEDADVTIGYHCGYISPIPYVELNEDVDENKFKDYIEALGNDIISWDSIREKFVKDNGITYANRDIAEGKGAYEIESDGVGKWVAGSTLCLNLKHLDKIPAFYNPEGSRGEDTFFSTKLNDSKVIKVPVYHFHDGFLKYTNITRGKYPKTLRKIKSSEEMIEQRFFKASRGWIRYKPLFEYIMNKDDYAENIQKTYEKLEVGVKEVNKLFDNDEFDILLKDLEEYDMNVKKHYNEYIKTNKIWDKLKKDITGGAKLLENIEKLREIEFAQREEKLKNAIPQKLVHKTKNKKYLNITYVMTWTEVCGGSKIILEQANRLTLLGHNVNLISHFPKPNWFPLNEKIKFIQVPWEKVLCEDIPKNSDIIIATYWREIYECIEQKIAPVVYFEQGDFHLFDRKALDDRTFNYINKQLQTVPYVFTVSSFAKEKLKEIYNKDSYVIPNAVDDKIFFYKEHEKNDIINITIIGSEQAEFKKIPLIIEAVNRAKKDGYKIKLNWITPTKPEKINEEAIINPKQIVIGDTLRKTDIYICASMYESFCLPVLEAMTCGAAIITTNNGGNMDFVRDNENALIIEKDNVEDIYEKLKILLNDETKRKAISAKGVEKAKNYSWKKTIEELEKYYRNIAEYEVE